MTDDYGTPTGAGELYSCMSRREHVATLLLAGLAANPQCARVDERHMVSMAVRLADALHAALAEGSSSC